MRAIRANVMLGIVCVSAFALGFMACSSPAADPGWGDNAGGGGGAGGSAGGGGGGGHGGNGGSTGGGGGEAGHGGGGGSSGGQGGGGGGGDSSGGGGGGGGGGSSAGGGGGGGGGGAAGGGGTVTGSINGSGGTESLLYFAVVGDTRPANIDDTSGYPTSIITQIYSDINGMASPPPFVIGTGDYQYASTSGSEQAPQIALYMGARAGYSGVFFPAMGNHECTGYTASNCGSNGTDGITTNYTVFMQQMLGPISQTSPYYSINVNATDNSWTAKLVFIAANAWDSTQSSWLSTTMAQTTTYTFVIRHEDSSANTAPGVSPSDQIVQGFPYTLMINGHTHTYSHGSGNEIVVGNGGAPVTGGVNYGFGLITQQSDKSVQVDMIDYQSQQPDTSFRFKVNPDGSAAP